MFIEWSKMTSNFADPGWMFLSEQLLRPEL